MSAESFPPLRSLQLLVWRLITAPEGAAAGAAALRRDRLLRDEDLSFLVVPDERLDATGRLDVYADMYFYRLHDCLKEDYPKLATVLGAAHFHNLVTDYLLAHPSRHFSLRELGRALPGFLARHPLASAFDGLADLARLEWARVDVFDEADAAPLGRDELLVRGAAAPESFRFGLVPATRLLRLAPGVLSRWRRLDEGDAGDSDDTPAPAAGPGAALVWRKGGQVLHRSLPGDEAPCLDALEREPATLARLGELVLAAQPPDTPDERVALRLATLLEGWSADGILREAPGRPDAGTIAAG